MSEQLSIELPADELAACIAEEQETPPAARLLAACGVLLSIRDSDLSALESSDIVWLQKFASEAVRLSAGIKFSAECEIGKRLKDGRIALPQKPSRRKAGVE